MKGANGHAAAAIALAALGLGCVATGLPADELPGEPIAFVYYDAEETRRRAADVAEKSGGKPAPRDQGAVIAALDDVSSYIRKSLGVSPSDAGGRYPGRLALIDPRTAKVTIIEGARKGAIPQDWSPDRERLLFSQVVRRGIPHLFEYVLATGEVRRRTSGRDAHPEGCYGPDGHIVYTSVDTRAKQRNARIMISGPTGGGGRRLSAPGYAFYPTCAPDGSAVAWTRVDDRGRRIQLVVRAPVLGGEPRVLSRGKDPSFSADGRWIVFSARIENEWTLWRVRPDGSGRASLGRDGNDEQRPSLSPDGRFVVYVADTKLHQELYLRRLDGTGNRILLAGYDGDRPVW